MSKEVFLKCGCTANAQLRKQDGTFVPSCIFHNCTEAIEAPSLEGRMMKCGSPCGKTKPSNLKAAFFQHRPDKEFDQFYCGCRGWD